MPDHAMPAPVPIDRVELVRNPVLTLGRAHALAMVIAGERGPRVTGEAVRWLAWPRELGAGWHLVFVGWTSRADDAQARGYSKHFPHRAASMEIIGAIKLGAFTKPSEGKGERKFRGCIEHAVVDSVIAWPPIPSQGAPGSGGHAGLSWMLHQADPGEELTDRVAGTAEPRPGVAFPGVVYPGVQLYRPGPLIAFMTRGDEQGGDAYAIFPPQAGGGVRWTGD